MREGGAGAAHRGRRSHLHGSSPARPSATSARTAPASRPPSRCSPASWCPPPDRAHLRAAPAAEPARLARQIGVVFGQRSQLWWDLPLRESFGILAAIHRLSRAEEAEPYRRARRAARDGRLPGHPGAPALPRPADARRDRGGAAALAAPADPRRADHRARRGVQAPAAGVPDQRAPPARHDPAAHHPRHGRRRAALRPGPGRGPRPARLRRRPAGPPGRSAPQRVLVVDLAEPADLLGIPGTTHLGTEAAACASGSPSTPSRPRPRGCWPPSRAGPRRSTSRSTNPTSKTSYAGSTPLAANPLPRNAPAPRPPPPAPRPPRRWL